MLGIESQNFQLYFASDFKLCFLVNMEYLESRDVRISLNIRDAGRFYLTDPVNRRTLVQKNSETWSADDLRKGFVYTIPAQERVLFVLERKRPENTEFLSPGELKNLSESIAFRYSPFIHFSFTVSNTAGDLLICR